jgi:divalent metal cation (Fe/Co/Zn/Cd) transporter
MNVHDAHVLAHRVKDAVRTALPSVKDVLIHIEPASAIPGQEP